MSSSYTPIIGRKAQADLVISLHSPPEEPDVHELELERGDQKHVFELKCGLNTLRGFADDIATLMDFEAQPYETDDENGPAEPASDDAIRDAAEFGWRLLDEMLTEDDLPRFLAILEALPLHAVVEFRQAGPPIFWNFVYLENPDGRPVEPMNFFGARWLTVEPHDVGEATVVRGSGRGFRVSTEGSGNPSYGLVDDHQLPAVKDNIEHDALKSHCAHLFSPLRGRDADGPIVHGGDDRLADLKLYGRYLARDWRTVHYAVHAVMPDRDQKKFQMRITWDFWHSIVDLRHVIKEHGAFSAVTFLFLNCCYSGLSPWVSPSERELGAAAALMAKQKGVRSAVCVLASVNDRYAARFAEQFYRRAFEAGSTVGKALAQARTAMLVDTRNPAALLYTLRGNAASTISIQRG